MQFNIMVLPGDGIGPEVVAEAIKVLNALSRRYGHIFKYLYRDVGGCAIDKHGTPVQDETLDLARKCEAVLFGSVGGPKWDHLPTSTRPERGLLRLRRELGLFVNLRPVKVFPSIDGIGAVKPERIRGTDLLVVRELTGGLYYAKPKRRWRSVTGRRSVDTMRYSEREIERVLRIGFELARTRKQKLTSVDKANVLETSQLWREIATELGSSYPDITLEHALVDSCAMQLINSPTRFDVLVTENTFGDILSDEASVLAASIGMLPSASLSGMPVVDRGALKAFGLYEPVHGSAPDIAGKGTANPVATILSASLMLRYSLGLQEEAELVEIAVQRTLENGLRTADIITSGESPVSTCQMGEDIAELVCSL